MKDIGQIKRQFEELVESLRQRRTNAEDIRRRATKETEDAVNEIRLVDAALAALKPAQSFYNLAAFVDSAKVKASPRKNRDAIVAIIEAKGRPMRAAEIAEIAHEAGTIKSESGYKGVYATVSTVLSRNRTHLFVQAGKHEWDIRARKLAPVPSSRKESAGAAETRGASRLEGIFEKVLKNDIQPLPTTSRPPIATHPSAFPDPMPSPFRKVK
jgi:hypothetical protein